MTLSLPRRGFLTGMLAACAAPAIIRTPGLLMPIKPGLVARPKLVLTDVFPGYRVGDTIRIHRPSYFLPFQFTLPVLEFDDYIVTEITGETTLLASVAS